MADFDDEDGGGLESAKMLLGGMQGAAARAAAAGATKAMAMANTAVGISHDAGATGSSEAGGQAAAAGKAMDCMYVKYIRVGEIHVRVSLSGFPKPFNLSGLVACLPSFVRQSKIGTAGHILAKFERHAALSLTNSAVGWGRQGKEVTALDSGDGWVDGTPAKAKGKGKAGEAAEAPGSADARAMLFGGK
jgi:hypothetical protein